MRKILSVLLLCILSLLSPIGISATENPTSVENNKFGIHIQDEHDLDDASRLVNSSGGDWGYITLVIREDERDIPRWQKIFDKSRRLHLIPIVRLATKQDGEYWTKPDDENIKNWVIFLESLNWVVKNRYIIVGNEPNHASEWGGKIDPVEYGEYYEDLAKQLKISSPDNFVMLAGLDSSAPDNKKHMSEEAFLRKMILENPKIFNYVDGWASHSYPNPNFSSSPLNTGQKSVRSYEWELSLLKKLGVNKTLPVFITETGWAHKTDDSSDYLDPEVLREYYIKLFDIYQNDPKVVAFTPFILNYSNPPFNIFSWKKNDGYFYPFFEDTQKVLKTKGYPIQITEAEVIFEMIPEFIKKEGKTYKAGIVKNTGQKIWVRGETIESVEKDSENKLEIDIPLFTDIEPGKIGIIFYRSL